MKPKPLLADIPLQIRDLHGVEDAVRGLIARGHDVVADDLHRVERAELAAVGAVAPRGMVAVVEADARRDQPEEAAHQGQNVRQDGEQPLPAAQRGAVDVAQNTGRSREQQRRREGRADLAGDRHRVERGDGQKRDPEQKRQMDAQRVHGHLQAVVDRERDRRDRRAKEPFVPAREDDDDVVRAAERRQHHKQPDLRRTQPGSGRAPDAQHDRGEHAQSSS